MGKKSRKNKQRHNKVPVLPGNNHNSKTIRIVPKQVQRPNPAAPPKPSKIRCFEINVHLANGGTGLRKDIRQYFQQPKGTYQALVDAFAFAHFETERFLASQNSPIVAIDRVALYEWSLEAPSSNGDIPTRRQMTPLFDWTTKDKIKKAPPELSKKQLRKVQTAAAILDKYIPVKTKVVIEEIGQEL